VLASRIRAQVRPETESGTFERAGVGCAEFERTGWERQEEGRNERREEGRKANRNGLKNASRKDKDGLDVD